MPKELNHSYKEWKYWLHLKSRQLIMLNKWFFLSLPLSPSVSLQIINIRHKWAAHQMEQLLYLPTKACINHPLQHPQWTPKNIKDKRPYILCQFLCTYNTNPLGWYFFWEKLSAQKILPNVVDPKKKKKKPSLWILLPQILLQGNCKPIEILNTSEQEQTLNLPLQFSFHHSQLGPSPTGI